MPDFAWIIQPKSDRLLGKQKGLPGYRVHGQIEDASELGVPQKRRRQLIVGVRNDLPGYFPPNLGPAARACLDATLGDAICDLPSLAAGQGANECGYDFERRGNFLRCNRESVRRRYLFEVLEAHLAEKLTNHVARPHSARDLRDFKRIPEGVSSAELMRKGVVFEFPYDKSSFKDRYTRQHRLRPCSTIVAHLSKDGLMFIHPTQNRSLTPREAARIQSFPDWFVFPIQRTHAFRLIGNAVPPLIAEAVGQEVRSLLLGVATRETAFRKPAKPSSSASAQARFSFTSRIGVGSIPRSQVEAVRGLERLLHVDRRGLRGLTKEEFLNGWYALLFLFPGLHPDNALDHGVDIETFPSAQLSLPGFEDLLARRYARSGWPVALELIGREAWRRFDESKIADDEFYCVVAQRAGLENGQRAKLPV